jgi:hypothetical protein
VLSNQQALMKQNADMLAMIKGMTKGMAIPVVDTGMTKTQEGTTQKLPANTADELGPQRDAVVPMNLGRKPPGPRLEAADMQS